MSNPEIKVGQKYRVIDAPSFGYPGASDGDVLEVLTRELIEGTDHYCGISEDEMVIIPSEITDGIVELIEDVQGPTEASEDAPELPHTNVPETPENVSQACTGSSTGVKGGFTGELLWKFITGSSDYNGHYQMEINEMPFGVLKETVRIVSDYVTKRVDTTADVLEIRLSYNGDTGKFAGTWSASVYQIGYWRAGEHSLGHTDRLLFGVEIVRGI